MRSPLLFLFALLVIAGGATLWLLTAGDDRRDGPNDARPIGAGPGASVLTEGQADEPGRLERLPAVHADAPRPLALAAADLASTGGGDASEPTALHGAASPRTLVGRVLTPDGQPQPGVEVAWLPGPEALLATGRVAPTPDPGEAPWRRLDALWPLLASTATDEEGRFRLHVEDAESDAGRTEPRPGPVVVVRGDDALALFSPGADDLGDLVLCSDGPFSVEVVDEQGQAVPGAWAEFVLGYSSPSACVGDRPQSSATRVFRSGHGLVLTLRPDTDTRFVRDGLPRGAGRLRAGAPGRATVSRYQSAADRTKPQPQVVLQSAGRVAGRVLAPDGQPRPGARVTITSEPGTEYPVHHGSAFRPDDDPLVLALAGADDHATRRALSDEHGRFAFEDIPLVLHHVFVQADGCQPLWAQELVPDGAPLELRLEAERRLEVQVRDEHGRPVDGARVEGWRGVIDDVNALHVDAPASPGDPFVVRGASERVTTVRASAPWHVEVAEQAREGRSSIRLVLPPAGAVDVLVRNGDQPVAGIEIYAKPMHADTHTPNPVGSATTGDDGHARIDHLAPGPVTVQAAASSLFPVAPRSLDLGDDFDVEVQAGELTTVVIDGRPKAVVRGHVAGAGAGARVPVEFERDGQRAGRALTDDEGAFYQRLAAGTYAVRVSGEFVATLELAPGEERELELPAARGARIEGRISSAGQPLAGWTVSAYGNVTGSPPAAVSDEQGRFELALPGGGSWRPRLTLLHDGRVRRQGPELAPVQIEPGGVALLDVVLPSASIAVRLVDEQGAAVTDLAVSIKRVDAGAEHSETYGVRQHPDEQGTARADYLRAGTWQVEVPHGWTWTAVAGEPFELADGAAYVHPDLVLRRACTVRGHAWAAPGVLAGDDVELLFIDDEGQREQTVIDDDGSFDISWLPPGRWQVVLVQERGGRTPVDVPPGAGQLLQLASGDDVTIDLVMSPLR